MTKHHTCAVYGMAHTDIGSMPFNNAGRTLRLVVKGNVEAFALSVRFSNLYGHNPLAVGAASLALCDEAGTLLAGTQVPLTVGGVLAFELPPGEEVLSDMVRFPLSPGQTFALNIYYPTAERVRSGNWTGEIALRSRPGNFSADVQMPGHGLVSRFARTIITADVTVTTTTVRQIMAHTTAPCRVLGCFGDSITQQSNWTSPLAKLLHHHYPGQISLCNLGISGNRLLGGSSPAVGRLHGEAGVARFERDLLHLPGLTHAVLALGTNDIGLPGAGGLPDSALITPEEYATAMQGLANRLHEKGVKVYAATLLPRAIIPPYTEQREALRQEMNAWLRGADCFDAVLDFDAVLRRDDGGPGMAEGCALPDGLHPNPVGGMLMAKSIDLSLFGEDEHG